MTPAGVGHHVELTGQCRRYVIIDMGRVAIPMYQDKCGTGPAPVEYVEPDAIRVHEPLLMRGGVTPGRRGRDGFFWRLGRATGKNSEDEEGEPGHEDLETRSRMGR